MNTLSPVSRRCLACLSAFLLCTMVTYGQGNLQQAQAEFQQNAQPLIDAAKSAHELANADIVLYRNALTDAYSAQTADQINVNDLNKKSAAVKSDIAEFHDRVVQIQTLADNIRAKYNIDNDTHLATADQANAAVAANNDIGNLQQMSERLDNTLSSVIQRRSTLPGGELTTSDTTTDSGTTTQTTTTTTTVSQPGTTYTSPVYVDDGPAVSFGFYYGNYYPWYNPWYYYDDDHHHHDGDDDHHHHDGDDSHHHDGGGDDHHHDGGGDNHHHDGNNHQPHNSPAPNNNAPHHPPATPQPTPPHNTPNNGGSHPAPNPAPHPQPPAFHPQPAPRPMPRPMPSHFGGFHR